MIRPPRNALRDTRVPQCWKVSARHIRPLLLFAVLLWAAPGHATWVQMTDNAQWTPRAAHSTIAMQDGSIVLLGGVDFSAQSTKNDVWRTTNYGVSWTQLTDNAQWAQRAGQSAVVLHDGSILLLGGFDYHPVGNFNDVWRSTNFGATWTQMTASAPWTPRHSLAGVVLQDGSILVLGGVGNNQEINDVWRSSDQGATWTQVTGNAGWSPRGGHACFAFADGSVVLLGGEHDDAPLNDVWRSTDQGATWTQITASAPWQPRLYSSAAATQDGKIFLTGGGYLSDIKNDVWMSPDRGETWTQFTANADWSKRGFHSSVALPDGSIVLTGGLSVSMTHFNDVWRYVHTPPPAGNWKTEIGIVNASAAPLAGTLRGLNTGGSQVWSQDINLQARRRMEMDVSAAAGAAAQQIKSMRLDITAGQAVGYQKFYQLGKYRVGLEASPGANQGSLFVPHIASNDQWWTGIGWTNTTSGAKTLQFSFDNGQSATKSLAGGGHEAFTIASLFGDTPQPGIGAAQVSGGAGMVGLMLFAGKNSDILSGVSLSDATATELHFPHVAHNSQWWTGLVVYNPGAANADLTLTHYDALGNPLGTGTAQVGPGQKMVGTPEDLNFPAGSQWFSVQSTQPVTGFELFATTNGQQLGGYSVVNLATTAGIFPKLERNGWTGIALVNPGATSTPATLRAVNDAGDVLATRPLTLNAGQKLVNIATDLFPGQDISTATYVSFTAAGPVIGFQLNGSSDGTMLDAIPALGSSAHVGTSTLFFPHIAVD